MAAIHHYRRTFNVLLFMLFPSLLIFSPAVGSSSSLGQRDVSSLIHVAQSPSAATGETGSRRIGSLGGASYAVVVEGGLAYLGTGSTLTIMDIHEPVTPTLVSSISTAGLIFGIHLQNQRVYLAHSRGLTIIDAADPQHPRHLGDFGVAVGAHAVKVSGNRVYLGYGNEEIGGLKILDVGNPAVPVELSDYAAPSPVRAVELAEDRVYLLYYSGMTFENGFHIIDASNPRLPMRLSEYDIGPNVYDMQLVGSNLYIAESSGLEIVNISDSTTPVRRGSYSTNGYATAVYVRGKFAILGESYSPTPVLTVVDISNPTHPGIHSSVPTVGWTGDVAGNDSEIYVTQTYRASGLRVMSMDPLSGKLEQRGSYVVPGAALNVKLKGAFAYVVSAWGLSIVDVSTPSEPLSRGIYLSSHHVQGLAATDHYAYLSYAEYATQPYQGGLEIIDISDPDRPSRVRSVPLPAPANEVRFADGYAYVVYGARNQSSGLAVIDVDKPSDAAVVGHYPAGSTTLEVVNGRAYVNGANGIEILDVRKPTSPTRVGGIGHFGSLIRVAGSLMFVVDGAFNDYVRIYDVRSPESPTLLGTYTSVAPITGLEVHDTVMYVATFYPFVLHMIDISDPTRPSPTGQADLPAAAKAGEIVPRTFLMPQPGQPVSESDLYLATQDAGLYIYRWAKFEVRVPLILTPRR
jgi:hypothetical protein